MNYRREAREVTQNHYGGYCEMCRKLGIKIVPYHKFTMELYDKIKELSKIKKDFKR